MSVKSRRDELRAMDLQRLDVKVEEMRQELLKLRLSAASSPSPSFASIKQSLSKDIARALTIRQEKDLSKRGNL